MIYEAIHGFTKNLIYATDKQKINWIPFAKLQQKNLFLDIEEYIQKQVCDKYFHFRPDHSYYYLQGRGIIVFVRIDAVQESGGLILPSYGLVLQIRENSKIFYFNYPAPLLTQLNTSIVNYMNHDLNYPDSLYEFLGLLDEADDPSNRTEN